MAVGDELRRALTDGDVALLWRMWGAWFPGSPQPKDMQEAEVQLHAARTAAKSVALRLRCYSHHWLVERGLDSLLPDELRPKADQFRPIVANAVGFSWSSGSKLLRPAKGEVQGAVGRRIEEMAADGELVRDPDRVRREMIYTKNRTLKELFGSITSIKGRTPA